MSSQSPPYLYNHTSITSRLALALKKSEVSTAIPVFSEDILHKLPESNNDLTMAAEGSSETLYHIGFSRTVVPKLRSVRACLERYREKIANFYVKFTWQLLLPAFN